MSGSTLDGEQMRRDFDSLLKIGATGDGGVNRPTFSDAHLEARKWFLARAGAAGLETQVDSAGNHSAIYRSRRQNAQTLVLGSHLDSVPSGGGYDGAVGVVGGLHVVMAFKRAGADLPFTLEAIDFTDEEGTLMGLLGSQAMVGTLDAAALKSPRGGREALLNGLRRAGLTEDSLFAARRDRNALAGYLELHIEQGPKLERAGIDIGVVTKIVGARSFRIELLGAGGHAGTTPMDARHDAGVAAARIIVKARNTVVRDFQEAVITFGGLQFEPGAFNVIPKSARLLMEFRAQDDALLDAIETAVRATIAAEAGAEGVTVEIIELAHWPAAKIDQRLAGVIEDAAKSLGLSTMRLPSGAGHDAQDFAPLVPAGMIFVPSVGGISHDPREFTKWEDVVNGANVLLKTVEELTRQQ